MVSSDRYKALEQYPAALFDAVAACYDEWLTRSIQDRAHGAIAQEKIKEIVDESSRTALENLYEFLSVDVDQQRTNPLHILRQSTRLANELLSAAAIVPPVRDEFETSAMPHDVYRIGPLTWRDLGEEVHEAGITWGAWKAATVLSRRRDEGKIV